MNDITIALINPNRNAHTTAAMVSIARDAADDFAPSFNVNVTGYTAETGAEMIVDMGALEAASSAVSVVVDRLANDEDRRPDAVIVSAFGDPGLDHALARFPGRAYGIGTESMRIAAAGRRQFVVATTTPGLKPGIDAIADRLGFASQYRGTFLTRTDPLELAAEPLRQQAELAEAVQNATETGGADVVIIGGGPLAVAARALSHRMSCELIEPIPAAIRAALDAFLDAR
jgi:allantoin racemase